ncbi:MAG: Unknown protein [uncultured Sulfurovum sp.]|uniref:Uncharacterized protein n=1 Tax=uncultured Sulfurovum sp. TaxID=269237 RepID=A0A6S6SD73_9BACT|nr:MAG: Unknown protein [uncultured Sulfurovum sp.]
MPQIHDPYLDTARRSLNDEKIKIRKQKIEKTQKKPKNFLSKNIILSDYITLPENLEKIILLTFFIFIPYIFGLLVIIIMMGYQKFLEYTTLNFDLFMLVWTIGYEAIAISLLLLIIKNAIVFKKSTD